MEGYLRLLVGDEEGSQQRISGDGDADNAAAHEMNSQWRWSRFANCSFWDLQAPTRVETDAFGPIEVETDKYWGAQTQR